MTTRKRSNYSFCMTAISGWLMMAMAVSAVDFTWLNSPTNSNWNSVDTNWSSSVGSVWINSSTNNAIFGVSDKKVVTADAVTLKNLTISADGYSIGGGPLLMFGGPTVGAGLSAVLTATVTNNVGLCDKRGTGTLVLDSGTNHTNLFSTLRVSEGLIQITGGTHEIYTNDANNINIGFDVNYGAMLVGGGKVRQTSGGYSAVRGTLVITNGVVDLSSGREFLNAFNGAGTTTVSGNGVLDVSTLRISQNQAVPASQSAVNVNTGGVIRLANFAIDVNAYPRGMVNFNGGTVIVKSSTADFLGTGATQWLNGVSAKILEGGAVIDTQANSISIKQPLVSGAVSDGGLTKKGTGALSLLSTNSYNGSTKLYGGTLNISQDQNLGAVPSTPATNLIFMASCALQSGSNHTVNVNRTFFITNGVTVTFDTQAYTQMVYGTIMCADTSSTLVKAGGGSLVLNPGPTSVNSFGTLQSTAGTLVIASGTNLVTRYCGVQNGPGLRISGGTLLVAGGVLKTTTGMFVNVDGGHLMVTNGLADLSSCNEVLNGIGSTYGYTTVSGSGVIIAQALRISQNTGNPSNTVVNVNTGGVLRLNNFYIDTTFNGKQMGILSLNGGTVEPRNDNADFLGTATAFTGANSDRWLTNILVQVREGGAIFNTAGRSISIKQPLYSAAAVDGGLTKRGNGTLTLLNTNTYNGVTSVEAGTLKLGVSTNTLFTGGSALVLSNAVFDINGKVQTLAGLGGSGVVTNGGLLTVTSLVAPGGSNAVGTLTLTTSPAALGGLLAVYVANDGSCDLLQVQGNLDISSLALSVANTEALNKDKRYVIATCTGTLSGMFTSAVLPKRWFVRYDTANRRVYLIYDPGTLMRVQ